MSDRVAVVTGSSTGIGRAIALRLAKSGARLILHGRTESADLKSVQASIMESGADCRIVCCDYTRTSNSRIANSRMSNAKSTQECDGFASFVDQAWGCFGRVDVWVNNAGGDVLTGAGSELGFSGKLDYLWQTDVRSTLLISRIVGQRMFDSAPDKISGTIQPVILNMGWDQAWQGMAGDSGEIFATTKGAIMAMTMSLARSFAPRVRVNCIAPGWIKTSWGETAPPEWAQRAVDESLMGRWGTPEDVAAVAMFLAGDDAAFISGQIVPVNGGFKFN